MTVKVFYVHQEDELYNLTPFLLLDGGRVWQCYKKRNAYYLFIDSKKYIKLWKDRRGNLLFYIGNTGSAIFSKEEPDMFYIDTIINYLDDFSDGYLTYVNNKIEFSIPIIGVVRRLSQWATRPLVFLLYQLFAHDTPAQDEAQEEEAAEEVE